VIQPVKGRPGWVLNTPIREEVGVFRVPVVHHASAFAMWVKGPDIRAWQAAAQLAIDRIYMVRRIQLDDLIVEDDSADGRVRVCADDSAS
jgi:hypothetical protein